VTVQSEDGLGQWLGEHVGWLISSAYGVQCDFSVVDVVPEVVELDINVLGPWVYFLAIQRQYSPRMNNSNIVYTLKMLQ